MAKIYGQLEKAALENLSSAPAAAVIGRTWWNTTSGKQEIDDGTLVRAMLRNDGKAVLGNSGTAGDNIRLHRGGVGILQLVTGADVTAEGSMSTALAIFSAKHESFATGSLPAAGNTGRVVYDTTTTALKVDNGSAFVHIDSGKLLTTKGDLLTYSTLPARLAVGTDGFSLVADSTQALGVKWASVVSPTPTAPKVTTYTTGSGTHTFTGSPLYVRVRMVGGGGGGGGGGADGTNGAASTFGTSLLSAGGGTKGLGNGVANVDGGAGGASSLGSGPVGLATTGTQGGPGVNAGTATNTQGGGGASSAFGGGSLGTKHTTNGTSASANSGAGGSGGGGDLTFVPSSGGGSGGFIDAVIEGSTLSGLSGSAAYAVGAGGTGGSAGATQAGGNGGSGLIEVTEYYQ